MEPYLQASKGQLETMSTWERPKTPVTKWDYELEGSLGYLRPCLKNTKTSGVGGRKLYSLWPVRDT